MPRTLGYHFVKSGYGLWLPGDPRGHWSEAWDNELGYIEPHALHPGDPVRLRMAEERMKHPPVRATNKMMDVIAATIGECAAESSWTIHATSIEPTHFHLLIGYTTQNIQRTATWLAQEMTKAIHRQTSHKGPVVCKGRWLQFVFDPAHWQNTIGYIERHNVRRGMGAKPYAFIQ